MSWKNSPPHHPIRFFVSLALMLIPFGYVVFHFALVKGTDIKAIDSTTLIETAGMNLLGLFLVYFVARKSLLAVFEHIMHVFGRANCKHCGGDMGRAAVACIAGTLSGWALCSQTIMPGAIGRGVTAKFIPQIGTSQFYKSGYLTLILGIGLVICIYAAFHYVKMYMALKPLRADLTSLQQKKPANARRARGQLPTSQIATVTQASPEHSTVRYYG
jgi:hypothetical protein